MPYLAVPCPNQKCPRATGFWQTKPVFSSDLEHSFRVAHQLNFGGIVINGTNNYRPPVVPFGGVGLAGSGREGLGYTFDELTRLRFIAVRNLRPPSEMLKGIYG